jgi:hypothetical protein
VRLISTPALKPSGDHAEEIVEADVTITRRMRHTTALATAASLAAFALLCTTVHAAEATPPLPPSDYTVSTVCPPPTPGHAACMALALLAATPAANTYSRPLAVPSTLPASAQTRSAAAGSFGKTPADLHVAYRLPTNTDASSGQTLALVDAYNDLSVEADLASYDSEFDLPECTEANGCFKKVNQDGEAGNPPFPQTQASLTAQKTLCKGHESGESTSKREEREHACDLVEEVDGWTVEISLDIETAHAICQNCHIALVEAGSSSYEDLETAEQTAARLPAEEISNSWGGPECIEGLGCAEDSAAFNHPGVVITASAGDDGYLDWLEEYGSPDANFPASLPQVVAVGGTRLEVNANSEWSRETVWNDGGLSEGAPDGYGAGGSGCSSQFVAQPWQQRVADWASVGCGDRRAVADIAADADPYTGVAVYDSNEACETSYNESGSKHEVHWCTIGGTSLASPLIAATFALAGGANGVSYPAQTLYENAANSPDALHDVTEGSNGECESPFNDSSGLQGCSPSQDAEASCSSRLICLASTGYDGPTGLGTPDGLSAFEPASEEESSAGAGAGASSGSPGTSTPISTTSASPQSSPPPSPSATAAISRLALTLHALIALNTSRPKIGALAFTFVLNVAAHVRASLEQRVGKHGHQRWKVLVRPPTVAAAAGGNAGRLGGHTVLGTGTYRLTLAPVHGVSRSIVFSIG